MSASESDPAAPQPSRASRRGAAAGAEPSAATCDLAILTPDLGLASETFIRRHCQELLPGRTAAVARTLQAAWRPHGPMLLTDTLRPPRATAPQRLARKFGLGASDVSPTEYAAQQTECFLREHGVRALLGEYLHWCVEQMPLARRLGLPLWAHGHGFDISAHLRNPRYQRAYGQFAEADGVILPSEIARTRLIELGLPAGKIHVIAYGTDVPDAPARHDRGETVRCLAVGRMVAKKGTILLLDAFRRAADTDRSLRLDVVGGGELMPAAQQFVQAFGLDERVTLHGQQTSERVRELLAQADVFLHHAIVDPATGDEEGLPVSILEAMAAALPVVATRHAGIPEAVLDEQTGLLCAEGDSAGMAELIVRLARDPALGRAMGQAGWERARERFSWTRERRELLGLMGLSAA